VVAGKSNALNGNFNFAVLWYNPSGTINGPFVATTLNPGISLSAFDKCALDDDTVERSLDEANVVAIQTDGRIVAAGCSDAPIGVNNTNFARVR
jgi:hypothetical protein